MSIIPAINLEVDAEAELDVGDDAVEDRLDKSELLPRIDSLIPFSATKPTGTAVAVDIGGPAPGRLWAVHRFTVCAYPLQPMAATDTSQAVLYAMPGGFAGPNQIAGIAGVPLYALPDTGFPMSETFGRFEVYMPYPMHLWVILEWTGSGYPTQVSGSVGVVDWHEATYIRFLGRQGT